MSLVYPCGTGIRLIGNNRIQITFGKDADGNNPLTPFVKGEQLRIIVGLNEPLKRTAINFRGLSKGHNSFGQVILTKEPNGNYYACFTLEMVMVGDKPTSKDDPQKKVHESLHESTEKVIAIDPNHTNSFVGFDGVNAIELARCYVQKNLDNNIDYIKSRRDKCLRKCRAVRNPDGSIKYWKPSRRWKQFNRVLNKLYAKRREQMKLFAYTIAHWLERRYDKALYGNYTPFAVSPAKRQASVTSGLKNTHRSMLSQGYVGYLRGIVKWVFEKNGKIAEEVTERKSTKTCHCCGNEILMPPGKRSFVCSNEKCNASLPRDVNSAINLYNWHHGSEKKKPNAEINLRLKWSPFYGLDAVAGKRARGKTQVVRVFTFGL